MGSYKSMYVLNGKQFSHTLTVSQVPATPGKVDFLLNYNFDWGQNTYFTADDLNLELPGLMISMLTHPVHNSLTRLGDGI